MRLVVVVASLTACFSKPAPPPGVTGDGGHDAPVIDAPSTIDAALCAQWNAFGSADPVDVPGISSTGAQHVAISNDGLEVIYDQVGMLYEAIRPMGGVFGAEGSVPGFEALPTIVPAAFSIDRLRLFYIDNSSTLIETNPRPTTADSFDANGKNLAPGVDDASPTSDLLHVAYSSNNAISVLTFLDANDNNPMSMPLLGSVGTTYAAPSFGDHDTKLVWSQSAAVMPNVSSLYEGEFDGTMTLKQIHSLGLNTDEQFFVTDPNLSFDGTTLYFTSTENGTGKPQLFVATRTCMH